MGDSSLEEARKAMIAKRFGGNAKGAATGGAGSVRRKNKTPHKSSGDDKKLSSVLKKMQLNEIKGVEEVNIFKDDGGVIHIPQPKIQASVPSNTFVVSGNAENKRLEEMFPGILTQLGPESMNYLRNYAEAFTQMHKNTQGGVTTIPEGEEEDDEVPALVENFEEAANK